MHIDLHSSFGRLSHAFARESTARRLLEAYAVFVLFGALATTFWFNLIGDAALGVLLVASTVASVVIWSRFGRPLTWHRLPWTALLYIGWAGLSVLWSEWRGATTLTWAILVCTTIQGLFLASILTWDTLLRALEKALKWIMGLSFLFELWAAFVVRGPVLPNFLRWDGAVVKKLYWTDGVLVDGGRIQGIVGNAHLLGVAALLAIIVFAMRIMMVSSGRGWLVAWIALSSFLLWRATSGSVWIAIVVIAVALVMVWLLRRASTPRDRMLLYGVYAGALALAVPLAIGGRHVVLRLLGKSSDFTGRDEIWAAVWERAMKSPLVGEGYTTPWLPWEPDFQNWIVLGGVPVFHAHNMWLDVFFQIGLVGLILVVGAFGVFTVRAWVFAVGAESRVRVSDRPDPITALLPLCVAIILLVQGFAESRPLMEWGWMFMIMFAVMMKRPSAREADMAPAEGMGALVWSDSGAALRR